MFFDKFIKHLVKVYPIWFIPVCIGIIIGTFAIVVLTVSNNLPGTFFNYLILLGNTTLFVYSLLSKHRIKIFLICLCGFNEIIWIASLKSTINLISSFGFLFGTALGLILWLVLQPYKVDLKKIRIFKQKAIT